MMEVLGYIGAMIMGLSLGLIGGGGSILTLPILVYLFGMDPVPATAYSLFIVGITSLIGSFSHRRMGQVHWQAAFMFGLPSIVAVFATRAWLLPAIPDPILATGGVVLTKPVAILIFFALLMLVAAYSMIRRGRRTVDPTLGTEDAIKLRTPIIMLEGLVVGVITGIVGAGGGFLIIPALVLLARLPMKLAVGTSLVIIAAKSLIGSLGDVKADTAIDWNFLLMFSAVATIGILVGTRLSGRLSNEKLKPAFGWAVLVMSVYIIGR